MKIMRVKRFPSLLSPSNQMRVMLYELFIVMATFTYAILLISDWFDVQHEKTWFNPERMLWIDRMFLIWFAVDFIIRLIRTSNRGLFVKHNWFDILAMIPFDSSFRIFRLLRVVRLIRLIRMSSFMWGFFRSVQIRVSLLVAVVIILWGASGFYLLEGALNEGIHSYLDAVWWAIVTTTTVGYGDIFPVTFGGRMIAIVLMMTGIGLIGSVTASVASHFIQVYQRKPEQEKGTNPRNQVTEAIRKQAHGHLDRLEHLSDEEYQSFLRLLNQLRQERG
ncbi:ion transporter [Desmospora profundinema]|uniref:Voltage-gated potassium channel n=1 Tax=Desmospora profundinema TaxID=1571184 RepID=A0ABU1IMN4_9BACL|nr:ion transporter [Desmospora profundinema]MDR6225663.1 voltage-gated potassium channel [Desmospora profundinema]